ncbi:MAG: cytidylate kinase-like family protein [Syntrophobacteraceae bacterium]|nr:cytidylate kinase-like family protein [Syntrophobacteraceae bacterium]
MATITISRGSYNKGKEVARKVAEKLGCRCIAREVILDACKEFNIPEIQLRRAIHDAPSILERFTHGKEKYIAYFKAALLNHLLTDNVVYHGLAGHFFVERAVRVLKVRIMSDMEDRVRCEMEREGVSREEALRVLMSDDDQRRKWSLSLYGIDTADPRLYDLVINLKDGTTVEHAAGIICQAAAFPGFQRDERSQKAIESLAFTTRVKAELVRAKPDVEVSANNGFVRINLKVALEEEEDIVAELRRVAESIPGVGRVDIKAAHRVKWNDGRLFP